MLFVLSAGAQEKGTRLPVSWFGQQPDAQLILDTLFFVGRPTKIYGAMLLIQ